MGLVQTLASTAGGAAGKMATGEQQWRVQQPQQVEVVEEEEAVDHQD